MSDSVTKFYENMSDREIMNAKQGLLPQTGETVEFVKSISEEDRKDAYKILAYYNEDAINMAKKLLDESKNLV